VVPTSDSGFSTITVNGVAVTSSLASQPITLVTCTLVTCDTVINVVVTAQDGVTQSTYVITVTRPASTDASLSDLSLSSGIAVPLLPQCDTATLIYTAKVDNTVATVTVTPTLTDDRATIQVDGQTVDSGQVSQDIDLPFNGINVINVDVTAEDGTTTQTYLIEVIREWPSVPVTLKASIIDPDAGFGSSVAIDGDTMVIGAPQDNDRGAVYVFTRDSVSGDWAQTAELIAPVPQDGSRFGHAVDILGDTIVVGVNEFNLATDSSLDDAGIAYVFRKINTTDWQRKVTLTSPTPSPSGRFGTSVSIYGDTLNGYRIVVGAPRELDKGVAHVYVCDTSFTQCSNEAALTAADGASGDIFGIAVAIYGDTIAVGAPLNAAGGSNRGAVYIYERAGTVWSELIPSLKASNADDLDFFGSSVALEASLLVVGAPDEDSSDINDPADNSSQNQGAAYVFRETSSGWTQTDYLKPATYAADQLLFGSSVAVDFGIIAIGAPSSGPASQSGKAYVFSFARSEWIEIGALMNPSSTNDSRFGASVDLDDAKTLVVGEPGEDTNGANSGAVQVFE
jgi:hypothetical protein